MVNLFKIRASLSNKIMGAIGLTETQEAKLTELFERKKLNVKPLTSNMESELATLLHKKAHPELPTGAKTYLKEWYAGDQEEIHSKYFDKGNMVEPDVIDMAADKLGFGFVEKNEVSLHDEYFTGTADLVLPNMIIDVKSPWGNKTLQEAATDEVNEDYIMQGRVYMRLYNKPEFILFYGLVDTPAEVNYEREISFAHIPENERWVAYKIKRDVTIEQDIVNRVIMCRSWLADYDAKVKSRLGRVIEI